MATPEAKVKRKVHQWLDINMPGHWRVSPRGGPFGKQGCPDDLVCWHGFFIAIEEKSLEGDASAMQMIQLKRIQQAGGVAAIIKGYDVVRLEKIKAIILAKVAAMERGSNVVSDK